MTCSCFDALLSKKCPLELCEEIIAFSPDKDIKVFTYSQLRSLTDNFNPTNKIGEGGYGTVYKGILKDGDTVAVKSLSTKFKQGIREFLTEIDVIAKVKLPNLVELIGCCIEGRNHILVYEYVKNNSLQSALLGPKSDARKLNWNIRSAICIGTAKGLAYLHEELEPPIVHRDIKASNILLDGNFAPKIGDFGLAKLFPDNLSHISTRVSGTRGYLAPEYAMQGQLTKKADVYSFGVLLIEIISGRSSSRSLWSDLEKPLLARSWKLYEEGRLKEFVDSAIKEYPEEEVFKFIKVALFCTRGEAKRRPSMQQVVQMLTMPQLLSEKELTAPAFLQCSPKPKKFCKNIDLNNTRVQSWSSTASVARPLASNPTY